MRQPFCVLIASYARACACLAALAISALPFDVAQGAAEPNAMTVDEAINYIKDVGHQPMRPAARKFLVDQGEQVIDRVAEVLASNDRIAQINATLVLLELIDQVPAERIKPHILRCLGDSGSGVSYLGLTGLLKLNLGPRELVPHLKKALALDSPLPTAILAAEIGAEIKAEELVPWVYRLAHSLTPKLARVINAAKREMASKILRRPGRAPGPEMEGGPAGRPRPGEEPERVAAEGREPAPERAEEEIREKKPEFQPDRANPRQIREFAKVLEDDPLVVALRRAGWALEQLTGQRFGFTPKGPGDKEDPVAAWELDRAVIRASGWYEKNKSRYPELEIKPHPKPKVEKEPAETGGPTRRPAGTRGARRGGPPPP